MIDQARPEVVAAFIAEPVAGATLGAAVPCEDYWPAIVEVCRRHGVLVIADEVMTGFGRTGRWFGVDHWERAAGHPHGGQGHDERLRARSGSRRACGGSSTTVSTTGFVHGFTWSHNGVGRGGRARAVLRRLREDGPGRARARGRASGSATTSRPRSRDCPIVGDVRGLGLDDRDRARRATASEGAVRSHRDGSPSGSWRRARTTGCCSTPSTGHVDGVDGDLVVLGPPFVHHRRGRGAPRRAHRRAAIRSPSRERHAPAWSWPRRRGSTTTAPTTRFVPNASCSPGT